MSPELIGILAVGIALAGLILNGQRRTDARFERLEKRMSALEVQQAALRAELIERMDGHRTELIERMDGHRTELIERMDGHRSELVERMDGHRTEHVEHRSGLRTELIERMTALETELRVRMAKLEGLLEGLREALTARQVA